MKDLQTLDPLAVIRVAAGSFLTAPTVPVPIAVSVDRHVDDLREGVCARDRDKDIISVDDRQLPRALVQLVAEIDFLLSYRCRYGLLARFAGHGAGVGHKNFTHLTLSFVTGFPPAATAEVRGSLRAQCFCTMSRKEENGFRCFSA